MINSTQKILLEMLEWFHKYCSENGITYYITGGTLLGAIRHKGFIPWDDDIDVMLPRPDYEKLLTLFKEKQGKYILETPTSGTEDYLYSYSKLYDTTTTLTERTRYKCKRGIYIDVFPLDGIGNEENESLKNYSHFDKWNMFLMTRTCEIRKERAFYKNLSILVARLIPKVFIDDKKLSMKVDELASKYSYEASCYVANLMGAYRSKEIIRKDILGTPTKYQFENIYVYGVEHYDEYLTHIYGNWRQLPPKEKQQSHHDYLEINLNKSYLDTK